MDERKFEIGEEVAIDFGKYGINDYNIARVIGFTKTGRINVEYKNKFNGEIKKIQFSDVGSYKIDNFSTYILLKLNSEIKYEIERKILLEKIEKKNWDFFPNEVIKDILDLLENYKKEKLNPSEVSE